MGCLGACLSADGAGAEAEAKRPTQGGLTTRSVIYARNGMAATSQPLATQVALDILKRGGSAVDAAIAANACLGLMEPTGCGIGGDLFALVWEAKTRRLHGLNASGRSPRSLTLEELRGRGLTNMPSYGPLPCTVPGCVDGWFELHARFGRLPMATNLAPAIHYAREGFPVSEVIAKGWAANAANLAKYPNIRETYMPGGRPPAAGEIFQNAALAKTLERIAAGGLDAFYRGEVAARIERFMCAQGGFLTAQDLAEHRSSWVEPVSVNYRGYDVWELPPNGQGIAALQILNVLEGYDLRSMGFGSAAYMHHFVEAKKLVFEDRARFYGDPDFHPVPVARLLSKEYAADRRKLIHPAKAASTYPPGDPEPAGRDTIYLAVADAEGNMVSLIQSNYRGMGSGMCPDGLGFTLHNRGEAFNLSPGHPNTYAPGKRPFHTIIPAFVTRAGEPFLCFGVMGGDMQPQGHVQILVNLIDFGMGLQEAGDAPRMYHTQSSEPSGERMTDGGTLNVERGFAEEATRALANLGHRLRWPATTWFGGYQAIAWDPTNRVYLGASESRKDGQAVGW
jgi:gamma-glutamyltranspeptidase/glutathione hydrolase